ncbi:hypothetical protein HYE24_00890 [Mycoplasmopsis bovis]|nr:hypothetical protein [Mycoplasmopsis bovis]QQH23620.1 hypothetical protein HYE24_00890 [Mycoplasmopsis bovis]
MPLLSKFMAIGSGNSAAIYRTTCQKLILANSASTCLISARVQAPIDQFLPSQSPYNNSLALNQRMSLAKYSKTYRHLSLCLKLLIQQDLIPYWRGSPWSLVVVETRFTIFHDSLINETFIKDYFANSSLHWWISKCIYRFCFIL